MAALVGKVEEETSHVAAGRQHIRHGPHGERHRDAPEPPFEELARRTAHGKQQIRRRHDEKRYRDAAETFRHRDPEHVPPAGDVGDVRFRSTEVERLRRMDGHHHETGDDAQPVKKYNAFLVH